MVMECEHRRERSRKALDRVRQHLSELDVGTSKVIVLVEDRLPSKSVGFCASRLADSLHKPVVIISMKGEIGIGEARSPKGVDLVEALAATKEFFLGFGGHKQAAGFSIVRDKVDAFKERFTAYLEPRIDPAVLRRQILIDDKLQPDDLKIATLKSLLCLEPFGEDNRRPIFLLESLRRSVLKEIDGSLRLGEVILSGDAFAVETDWEPGDKVSLVVSLFGDGSVRIVEVVDWKKAK